MNDLNIGGRLANPASFMGSKSVAIRMEPGDRSGLDGAKDGVSFVNQGLLRQAWWGKGEWDWAMVMAVPLSTPWGSAHRSPLFAIKWTDRLASDPWCLFAELYP